MFLRPKESSQRKITRSKLAPSPKRSLYNSAPTSTMMVCLIYTVPFSLMNRKRRGYYSSTCQYCWQAPAECLNALQKRGSACLLSSAKPIGFCGTGKVSPSSCPLPSRAKLSHSMVSTAHSSNEKKNVWVFSQLKQVESLQQGTKPLESFEPIKY